MKIKVISKVGDTVHPKYGRLVKGMELDIEEADFGKEIFKKKSSSPKEGGSVKKGGIRKGGEAPLTSKRKEE
jgi:hypothetical protein